MKVPRYIRLSYSATALSAFYSLAGELDMARVYIDMGEDLMDAGADMPPEIMAMISDSIVEGFRNFVPALRALADQVEGMAVREIQIQATPGPAQEPKHLAQDNEFERVLSMVSAPGTRGVTS